MSHLSRDELLLFAEGALPRSRRTHVDSCGTCRERAEDLADTVTKVRDVPIPEPAPAFWDHLSARVRSAIDAEPAPRAPVWWNPLSFPRAAQASAAVALALIAVLYATARHPAAPGIALGPAVPSSITQPRDMTDAAMPDAAPQADHTDDEWDMVLAVASVAEWEPLQAEMLMARPGHADLAMSDLSRAEVDALVQLLNDALASQTTAEREG